MMRKTRAQNLNLIKRYRELDKSFETKNAKSKTLRVNTLKIKPEELIKKMDSRNVYLEKIVYLDKGYLYKSKFSLGATNEYLQGYYYLQEAASQVPVEILKPGPGETILDMAASPGSKATQIGEYMKGKGVLVCLDIDNRRMNSLLNNLERCGVKNAVVYNVDALQFETEIKFDKILLDAPCSGNYCEDPSFLERRKEEDFLNRQKLQLKLLQKAASLLKEDGTLVYSTCSLEPEENEIVIDKFLKEHTNFQLEETGLKIGQEGITNPFGKELNSEIKMTRRFWPYKTGTQGFFVAKLTKKI